MRYHVAGTDTPCTVARKDRMINQVAGKDWIINCVGRIGRMINHVVRIVRMITNGQEKAGF
jgi:hypothetical protein